MEPCELLGNRGDAVLMPKRICQECGRAIDSGSRCADHRSKRRTFGRPWRRLRETILERDKFTCRYCGRPANTVDHIYPVERGGTHDPSNLAAACSRCNESKGAKTLQEWRPDWTEEHELRARLR